MSDKIIMRFFTNKSPQKWYRENKDFMDRFQNAFKPWYDDTMNCLKRLIEYRASPSQDLLKTIMTEHILPNSAYEINISSKLKKETIEAYSSNRTEDLVNKMNEIEVGLFNLLKTNLCHKFYDEIDKDPKLQSSLQKNHGLTREAFIKVCEDLKKLTETKHSTAPRTHFRCSRRRRSRVLPSPSFRRSRRHRRRQ